MQYFWDFFVLFLSVKKFEKKLNKKFRIQITLENNGFGNDSSRQFYRESIIEKLSITHHDIMLRR